MEVRVELMTLPANHVAGRLYASMGFVETGETLDNGEVVARLEHPPA